MHLNFYMPTKVIEGVCCIKENKELIRQVGKKALIVTGKSSAKKNGSLRDMVEALEELGISYEIFDKVMSNPTVDCVYEGAAFAKAVNADFIIAIGGGSPMDAGKAIALLAAQEVAKEDIFKGNYKEDVLPMIHVPTTAGTGSEVTPYAILTNDEMQTKTSISSPKLFPAIAFCDPTYMMDLSREITVNTTIDALSHAVEGMLTKKANQITDLLAVESIKIISKHLEAMHKDTLTIQDRGELLYASTLAGMVIAHTGTTAVHSMGYSLTYFKDVDHGRANGLLLAEFLHFVQKQDANLVKPILSAMNLSSVDEVAGVLNQLLGRKETCNEDEIQSYANLAIKAKNIKNSLIEPTKDDLIKIFTSSLNE